MQLNLLPTIQQAISGLLLTYKPEFLRFGYRLFLSLRHDHHRMARHPDDVLPRWAGRLHVRVRQAAARGVVRLLADRLLRVAAAGHRRVVQQPDHRPGVLLPIGCSRPERSTTSTSTSTTCPTSFIQPDAWSILANLIYWIVLLLIAFAKAVSMAVIAFGLIASAVCALLGPLFVPFFIVPKLDWLFWGWFKAFIQYSFIPVVAIAFLMVFERFVFRYVTTLPPTITQAEYGIYGLQAVAVIITFCTGVVLVPSLTTSIFSGQGGQAAFPGLSRFMRR